MNTKIEEMTKEIKKSHTAYKGFCPHNPTVCSTVRNCLYCNIATHLIEQGYRKIPEGSVVLTEEELDKKIKPFRLEIIALCKDLVQTRKETAEKFAEMLKEKCKMDNNPLGLNVFLINGTTIDEICKEIVEGEV